MDRFQRYALIIGPIVGALIFYLVFTTMSDQLSGDRETLGELGPVTLGEVGRNPTLLASAEGETADVEAGAEVTATMAMTATEVVTTAAPLTGTADMTATMGVTQTTAATGTAALTASAVTTATEVAAAAAVTDMAAMTETDVMTATEVVTATAAATAAADVEAVQVTEAITDGTIVTATGEVVIAATVTDTARVVAEAAIAENVVWFVRQFADADGQLVDVVADSAITMQLSGDTISGTTGCSNYVGSYSTEGENRFAVRLAAVSPAGTELESCLDGGELNIQEANYFNALENAYAYITDGTIFEVSNEEGDVILHYELSDTGN